MARSEARLSVSIWADPDFLALSPTAQRMFMFLLSQPDLAHDGVIALRERRWSKSAAGMTSAHVSADLEQLRAARFVVIDEDAEEMLIRSFIRRDKVYRQPNVLRAAADHLSVVSSRAILAALAEELRRVATAEDIGEASKAIVADMLEAIEKASPKGSGKGSGNPSAGTPGERGVVTAVSRDSPFPVPRAPGPRPQSSTGGRAGVRETPPAGSAPPSRCEEHLDHPDPPACGRCGDARKARERYDRDQAAANARAQSERARQQAETSRAAIDACQLCDHAGQRDGRLCLHDPDMSARSRRGAELAAAAIRRTAQDTS